MCGVPSGEIEGARGACSMETSLHRRRTLLVQLVTAILVLASGGSSQEVYDDRDKREREKISPPTVFQFVASINLVLSLTY